MSVDTDPFSAITDFVERELNGFSAADLLRARALFLRKAHDYSSFVGYSTGRYPDLVFDRLSGAAAMCAAKQVKKSGFFAASVRRFRESLDTSVPSQVFRDDIFFDFWCRVFEDMATVSLDKTIV